jgi:hypothetical protein
MRAFCLPLYQTPRFGRRKRIFYCVLPRYPIGFTSRGDPQRCIGKAVLHRWIGNEVTLVVVFKGVLKQPRKISSNKFRAVESSIL